MSDNYEGIAALWDSMKVKETKIIQLSNALDTANSRIERLRDALIHLSERSQDSEALLWVYGEAETALARDEGYR